MAVVTRSASAAVKTPAAANRTEPSRNGTHNEAHAATREDGEGGLSIAAAVKARRQALLAARLSNAREDAFENTTSTQSSAGNPYFLRIRRPKAAPVATVAEATPAPLKARGGVAKKAQTTARRKLTLSTVARVVSTVLRPATEQPIGGGGKVLSDGEGATPTEIAASMGGPTAGKRGHRQRAARTRLINAVRREHTGPGPVFFRCWRCGQLTASPRNLHLGHRNVPASLGGNLEPVNVALEGASCNVSAGDRGKPSKGMSCFERGSCGASLGRFREPAALRALMLARNLRNEAA